MKTILLLVVVLLVPVSGSALAGSYPRDGRFKRLPGWNDKWYYVDNTNWYIKAPDKWTHMMGSMGSTLVFSQVMNKRAAGALVFSLGVAKEFDDGYREGWSYRDLIANVVGIGSALLSNEGSRLLCDYNEDSVMLKMMVMF